jgi:L,D-transpeptidase YcbB
MGLQIKRGWLAIACFGFLCLTIAYWYIQSPEQVLTTPAATAMEILPSIEPSTPGSAPGHPQQKQASAEEKPLTSSDLAKAATTASKPVTTFYAQHQWQPVWDKQRLSALLTEVRALKADGLNPDDYQLAELERCHKNPACTHTAELELLATRVYLLALQHLYLGRVNPAALDPHWNFDTPPFEPEYGMQLAREAVEKNRLDIVFQRARPSLPRYMQMRSALIRLYQQAEQGGWPLLPEDPDQPSLKPGTTDNRIPLLRQRLQVAGLLNTASDKDSSPALDLPAEQQNPAYFDSTLENAVRRFQQASFLVADGVVGKQTLQALNVPITERIGQLRVNLERMRWHLREISGDYVTVDVAGYNITYMHNGQAIWKSRVQVGKRYRKTPIFQSAITRITSTRNGQYRPPSCARTACPPSAKIATI